MLALRSRPEGPRGLGPPPKKASPTCATTPRGVAGGDVILTLDQLLKRDGGGGDGGVVGARAARPKETEPPNGRHKTKKKAACLSGVLEEIAKLSQDFSTYQEELRRKSNTSSPRSASSLSCACNGPETTPVATPSPPPTCTPTPEDHGPTEQMMNARNTWLSFHLGVEEREEEEEGEREHECAAIPPTVPPRSTSIVGGHSSSPCAPRSSSSNSSSRLMQLVMQQQQKPLDSRSSVEQQKQQQQKQQQQQQQKQQQQHLDSRSHAEPESLGRPVTLKASSPPRQGAAKSVGTVSRSSRSGRNRGSSSSNGKSSISGISSGSSSGSSSGISMKAPTTPELGSRIRVDGVCGRVGSADAAWRRHPVDVGRADAMQGDESTGTLPPLQTRFSLPARPSKRRLPSRWAGRAPPESPDSGRQEPPSRQEPTARPAPKGARVPTACPPAPGVARPPADSYNIHDIMDILSWGDLRSSAV
ncbi:uncharacterized protein LOC116953010 [Petromyzon marinus]|uniref:Probable serine/threonine-protein kinase DDB_G0267686 n=1 Tax=Petromyzon marinus TaxID=7757 RepID=A0AAJ7U2W6_PETMA|nr:probable serine/threonine-protein kinase DDB_G0267686 [Petromyzon marinus]